MDNIVKAKEPWLGVLLNMIFPGIGEFYAKRKNRALIIIGVYIFLLCLSIFSINILINPKFAVTKSLLMAGIAFVIFGIGFNLFVLIDVFLCVRNFNISVGVNPINITVRLASIIGCIVLFLTGGIQFQIATYIRNNVVQSFKISSGTMQPALQAGDRIFVDKQAFIKVKPQRWDIVVFHYTEDTKKLFIQRVIGLPGETLEIKEGSIIINGKKIESKIYYYNRGDYGKESQEVEIPQGNYFVLGDNSAASKDSRYFGFVPEEEIIGKAIKIYWPLERSGKVE